jgi:peptidoglycan/LPS O-acetylase OafA/YrhL
MPTIRELAGRTPQSRRRSLDLLRAAAITMVVIGHWFIMTVERDASGRLTGFTALPELTSVHPLTWLFQVMPVFFLVGGVANAISWTRHRDRGRAPAGWLLDRSARLFPPVTTLLVVIALGALVAGVAGVPVGDIAQAVALVTLPLWFLVVYLGVIALTPTMYRLHERFGLAVPAVLVALVVVGDAARLATGAEAWAFGSFAFAWVAVHQVGFAWEDGSLRLTPRRAVALLVGSLVALVLLTGPGPYPVSMVSVPGAAIQNPSPPTVALLTLAAAQVALAALVAGPAERWLLRRRPWTVVLGTNTIVLTLYLWHMVAALVGAFALDALGLLPSSDVHTSAWWLGRVPWIAALAVVLAVLVAIFGRVEARTLARRISNPNGRDALGATWVRTILGPRTSVLTSTPVVVAGYLGAILGIFWLASAGLGPHGPFMIPTGALLLFLGGAAVLWSGRAVREVLPSTDDRPGDPVTTRRPAAHLEGAAR